MARYNYHFITSIISILSFLHVLSQTKTINTTYTYDGKKYPLQMEVTDYKALLSKDKTYTYTSYSPTASSGGYHMSGKLYRLLKRNEKFRIEMQKADDKKKFISTQLDEAYNLYEGGDYAAAQAILQTKEIQDDRYLNDKYSLVDFLTAAKLGQFSKAFQAYIGRFTHTEYDHVNKKNIPGTTKSWLLDDPGTRIARTIQDRFTEKQWFEVELAFSELLLQKDNDKKDTYFAELFRNETPLIHLNKTIAFFSRKGFNTVTDPAIILLYETCGDSVKSNQMFSSLLNGSLSGNGTKYQICKYIINQAKPTSSLLRQSVSTMQKLYDAAKDNDEKIVTKLELIKGNYMLGNYSTATTYALDLAILLPQKTTDYCSVTMLLGQLEQSQQQYALAITQYDYVIAFATDADQKKTALTEKATCQAELGNLTAALDIYDQLYKESPDKFTANECATFYISKNEYDRADKVLSKALKEDPEFYLSLLNYGDLLVATGKPKKARPYYVRVNNMSGDLTEAQKKIIDDYK